MVQDNVPNEGEEPLAPPAGALTFRDWHFSVDQEGIGWAIFDREGQSANALGSRPLEELSAIVDWAEEGARRRTMCGLVILSGKDKGFIVGADINEFEGFETEAQVIDRLRLVLALFDRIERLPIPVVAGIHGVCVGGGLELVLACHYRIATRDPGTRVGFPEVKLGIFPGWHGTARSIRQAGPIAAMQAMLTGSMISATRARAMGLIDELVASRGALRWAARRAVLKKRKAKPAGLTKSLLTRWPARALLAKKMRDETSKKAREAHYPAPFRLIDLFELHGGDIEALKAAETRYFAPLLISDQSRNLRRVFKLSELLKGQAPKDQSWKPVRVHVIGAGTMGADIAGWCVASGMEVTLQDLSAEVIEKGIKAQGKL
ncbi:MAG TPA: enoyl-CoA hydratase-related protein, partial [Hyphomicrobium sp.]|nr:enoyl-CoA hydratase-related protein [Hyphomicrobium sp.]